jgi:predicted dithiol-disulfide oxidoreductase (DUF899 family)
VSSFGTSFNYDFGVSFAPDQQGQITYNFEPVPAGYGGGEMPGLSAFYKNPSGEVFHTYSSYARGPEELIGTLMILDRAPLGRSESTIMNWVRRHDEYESTPAKPCHAA